MHYGEIDFSENKNDFIWLFELINEPRHEKT